LVNSFSGTANGFSVAIIAVDGDGTNDNYLYSPATSNTAPNGTACGTACQLDDNGLAFSLGTSGGEVVIFEFGNPMNTNCDTSGTSIQCGQNSDEFPGSTIFSASPVSATPLPAALPLFATGLGAMGLFGWRRKRKNASAITAA
jgi:hypothetical protein